MKIRNPFTKKIKEVNIQPVSVEEDTKAHERSKKVATDNKTENSGKPIVQPAKTTTYVHKQNDTKNGQKNVTYNGTSSSNRSVFFDKNGKQVNSSTRLDDDFNGFKFPEKFQYKPLVNKKLTVLLIENTATTLKEKEILKKIIKTLIHSDLVCFIQYNSSIKKSEVFDIITSYDIDKILNTSILCDENVEDTTCLFDALLVLETLVLEKYMSMLETDNQKIRVNSIEIIGIGTCRDNGSKVSKETGIEAFCKVASKINVSTKYFCLTEKSFMNAAEIGFRSVGSISRKY